MVKPQDQSEDDRSRGLIVVSEPVSLIGYQPQRQHLRVSTAEQNPDLQFDAVKRAGRRRIFTDQASGARGDRRGLADALSHLRDRAGDTLVVWKLDGLARTVRQLVEFVADLAASASTIYVNIVDRLSMNLALTVT